MKGNKDSIKIKPFISKEWWKALGPKTMGSLGKLSKSFLLPIALLPIAGLFLGIGAAINQYAVDGSSLALFATVLNQMGNAAFSNLPTLFLISAIIAYTDDSGSAVLAGFVAFLVFNAIIASLSTMKEFHMEYTYTYTDSSGSVINSIIDDKKGIALPDSESLSEYVATLVTLPDGATLDSVTDVTKIADTYSLLFWKSVPAGIYGDLLGFNTLNTGVFAGIIIGCVVAWVYNRTYKVQLPSVINFFSGIKFVPIVMFFAIIPLAFLFMFVWPPIGKGLNEFGKVTGDIPYGFDSFIFELIERSLVPFGLHHVFYAPLWWTSAGGGPLSDSGLYPPSKLSAVGIDSSLLSPTMMTAVGDQTMLYALIAEKGSNIDFDKLNDLNVNLGRFQTGKFPFMMFGLPAAATAMWLTVPKENRKEVMGIYFSAAGTSLLTGITEPIEYTFLFVAPWLFYGIHVPLAALSFLSVEIWPDRTHVGMTVSGGFIDFIIFGILPLSKGTHFWHILVVGPVFSVVYFFLFYYLIKWRDVKIPGRDGAVDGETKLYTKADYKSKKASKSKGQNAQVEKASIILTALGGKENIETVDACASRLRVNVHDLNIVDKDKIKAQGASAVLSRGNQVQSIFGGESDVIKSNIKDIISGKVEYIDSSNNNDNNNDNIEENKKENTVEIKK